ncbi:hypothetical protein [Natrinema sp. 74]|uniref:hypothetical protein n=1 Tax=Natrinema sp. 74 TaxID=3384159 RepID=UPI0038D42A35
MRYTDTNTEIDDESVGSAEESDASGGRYVSRARQVVRDGGGLGLIVGVGGGVSLLGAVCAFRRGDRERAFGQLALGGVLVAIALELGRPIDEHAGDGAAVDQTDIVSTAPDIGDLEEGDSGGDRHASGAEAQQVVDSTTDLEEAASNAAADVEEAVTETEAAFEAETETEPETEDEIPESETEAEIPEPDAYERLGAAAFDEHSSEIPVPQEAFNRNVLSLSAEAFWGIRDEDDAVVISERFDPIQDRDGIRYVASSEIDGDRLLTIPDTVLNHWDAVAGGGTAVTSGDEIAFVTAESLKADGQLRLVPEQWFDDVFENGE